MSAEKCKKCYACLNIGCPALSKAEDGSVRVDPEVCVGCYMCVGSCKFDALAKPETAE
ncbi:MAG: 4Fe-4S binding protein [Candidatus Omnitrophica bacterium]|nr:4Fe-4S binding protein [Candidatus Omnitrophota bacterium]